MRLLFALSLIFILSSCSSLFEDYSIAKDYAAQADYPNAISEIEKFASNESKKINSKFHLNYAIQVLKNLEEDQFERYTKASELLKKSVELNPKNKEARTYYLMVLKTIKKDYPES